MYVHVLENPNFYYVRDHPLFKQEGHDGPGLLTWENMNQMLKTIFDNHNQHSDHILWRLRWNVAIYRVSKKNGEVKQKLITFAFLEVH